MITIRFLASVPVLLGLGLWVCASAFSSDKYEEAREAMVRDDIEGRGIADKRVLEAMRKVPRHLMVEERYRDRAYGDFPLPIGEGQTISQPYVVAMMTEALELGPGDKVLEIGTGSGYQAAVLAEIVKEVYTIEIRKNLAQRAGKNLAGLGYENVQVKNADGYFGWQEHAPYDAVIVTASANHIPTPLIKQLKTGGQLIIPLGDTAFYQVLTLVQKRKDGLHMKQMGGVSFVPMTGEIRKRRPSR